MGRMTGINRLPTKSETIWGAFFSLLLSAGVGYVLWFVIGAIIDDRSRMNTFILVSSVVLALIFAWSSALFLRILFGKPQLPSFRAQRTMGVLLALGGALLGIAYFLPGFNLDTRTASRGLAALVMGLVWVYQARKA